MNLANRIPAPRATNPQSNPDPVPDALPGAGSTTPGEGWRVILFNDDTHTMDEVTIQLMLALHCPAEVAVEIMLTAHRTGRATVTITTRPEAERIGGILQQIDLQVRVEPV